MTLRCRAMPSFPKPDWVRPVTYRHAESRPPKRERRPRARAGRQASDASPRHVRRETRCTDLKGAFFVIPCLALTFFRLNLQRRLATPISPFEYTSLRRQTP